jgi:hypothetical protein
MGITDFEIACNSLDGDYWSIKHRMNFIPTEEERDLFDDFAMQIEKEIEMLINREIIQELIELRKEQLHKENIWNSLTDICKTKI